MHSYAQSFASLLHTGRLCIMERKWHISGSTTHHSNVDHHHELQEVAHFYVHLHELMSEMRELGKQEGCI
jgi:hypothetical protein